LLEAHAIAAVPLKGPALTAVIYEDLSLRECVDIDILIRRRDALRAKDVLLSAGYELTMKLNRRGFPSERGKHEYEFVHPGSRTQVELCWRIAPQPFLASLHLDDRRADGPVIQLIGTPVAHLPPEEHLLTLCVHGGKHGWSLLKWVCDVSEFVRATPNLEWKRLRLLATRLGCRRAVALGLLLAHDLLDAPLPQAILSEAGTDLGVQRLAGELRADLFTPARGAPADAPAPWSTELVRKWRRWRYLFRLVERTQDKLWNCLLSIRLARPGLRLLVPTEKDRAVLSLPAPLAFLYYLLRPGRVAVHYGLSPAAKRLSAAVRRIRPAAVRPD
jgi:Uncharacterised nucleotidyltransferase